MLPSMRLPWFGLVLFFWANLNFNGTTGVPYMPPYHESQKDQLCALHALNNLFQQQIFSRQDLDSISSALSFTSRQSHSTKHGDYDIEVINVALKNIGYQALWLNKKNRHPRRLNFDNIEGFLLNPGNHWIALKEMYDMFYNLDSKKFSPAQVGTRPKFINFLIEALNNKKHILAIVDDEDAKKGSWLKKV